MDNLLTATFEAHNDEKNHHRRYSIRIGRDLLDDWTVTIEHGRTGQAGKETRLARSEVEVIQAIVRDRLRCRLSAPKRIGCSCRLARLDAAIGFDCETWLPAELMASFSEPNSSFIKC